MRASVMLHGQHFVYQICHWRSSGQRQTARNAFYVDHGLRYTRVSRTSFSEGQPTLGLLIVRWTTLQGTAVSVRLVPAFGVN